MQFFFLYIFFAIQILSIYVCVNPYVYDDDDDDDVYLDSINI